MDEPQVSSSLSTSIVPQKTRLTVGMKASYPLEVVGAKVYLSPMVSLSEDIPEGSDIKQETARIIGLLRPAFGLSLLSQYVDASGLSSGKSLLEIAKSMSGLEGKI